MDHIFKYSVYVGLLFARLLDRKSNDKTMGARMRELVLHPTEMSQWHAIIHEAQASTKLILNEDTESYLVFLLMRFCHATQLAESVVALDFLHAMNSGKRNKMELLRDVGDKSLLFSGLFPGLAERKQVSLDYFTDLGQAAYLSVGELYDEPELAHLYYELSQKFLSLQQILQALRGENQNPGEFIHGIVIHIPQ